MPEYRGKTPPPCGEVWLLESVIWLLGKLQGLDPKLSELPMARVKSREIGMEARTF